MNWPNLKKWGKYVLIILIGIAAVVLFLMIRTWLKKREQAEDGTEHVQQLGNVIDGIRGDLTMANHQAEVEIAVSRSEEEALKGELATVVQRRPDLPWSFCLAARLYLADGQIDARAAVDRSDAVQIAPLERHPAPGNLYRVI